MKTTLNPPTLLPCIFSTLFMIGIILAPITSLAYEQGTIQENIQSTVKNDAESKLKSDCPTVTCDAYDGTVISCQPDCSFDL